MGPPFARHLAGRTAAAIRAAGRGPRSPRVEAAARVRGTIPVALRRPGRRAAGRVRALPGGPDTGLRLAGGAGAGGLGRKLGRVPDLRPAAGGGPPALPALPAGERRGRRGVVLPL